MPPKHDNPAMAELLDEPVGDVSEAEARAFIERAYDLGKDSLRAELDALRHDQANLDAQQFLDSTAQQAFGACLAARYRKLLDANEPVDPGEPEREAAVLAYDAAHALLQERERRRK